MTIKRSQVGCLLMLVLSFFTLQQVVFGARYLHDMVDDVEKPNNNSWSTSRSINNSTSNDDDQGFFATINREVPSCPDPLHNR